MYASILSGILISIDLPSVLSFFQPDDRFAAPLSAPIFLFFAICVNDPHDCFITVQLCRDKIRIAQLHYFDFLCMDKCTVSCNQNQNDYKDFLNIFIMNLQPSEYEALVIKRARDILKQRRISLRDRLVNSDDPGLYNHFTVKIFRKEVFTREYLNKVYALVPEMQEIVEQEYDKYVNGVKDVADELESLRQLISEQVRNSENPQIQELARLIQRQQKEIEEIKAVLAI